MEKFTRAPAGSRSEYFVIKLISKNGHGLPVLLSWEKEPFNWVMLLCYLYEIWKKQTWEFYNSHI